MLKILIKIKVKFARSLISAFPLNVIRVYGLRMCGFKVGKDVYIGTGLIITMPNAISHCELVVGDRVAIAPRVTLVLQSNANWSRIKSYIEPIEGKIILNNDCWIGAGAIILPNITVGEMSIVGAGSIVNKDVESYNIVAGNPAKRIRTIQK